MILFTSYYKDERQGEIEFCLKRNCENPHIDEIILFAEDMPSFEDPKIYLHKISERPTMTDFFREMALFEGVKVVANSDVFFDESIRIADKITHRQAYCLTRHEYPDLPFESNNGAKAQWSADSWFFRKVPSKIPDKVLATKDGKYDLVRFCMGVPGVDNHLAYLLSKEYKTINPYPQIKCIHVHKEKERNYKIPWRITGDRSRWGRLKAVPPSTI